MKDIPLLVLRVPVVRQIVEVKVFSQIGNTAKFPSAQLLLTIF